MADYKFYRVYQTINKLLYKRGYHMAENHDISFEDFRKLDRNDLTIKTESREDQKIQNGSIFVFFPDKDDKVGVGPFRTYFKRMQEEKVQRAIVIVIKGITSFAIKEIKKLTSRSKDAKDFIIETFTESELVIDITEHELVPEHQMMTLDEKEKFLSEMGLKEQQLPKMLLTDPISRYYGLKRGDMVKITRLSETAGVYENYRIVIGVS